MKPLKENSRSIPSKISNCSLIKKFKTRPQLANTLNILI